MGFASYDCLFYKEYVFLRQVLSKVLVTPKQTILPDNSLFFQSPELVSDTWLRVRNIVKNEVMLIHFLT